MTTDLKYIRYVYFIKQIKAYTADIIKLHVEHLKRLERNGQLVLCGPFQDNEGGIVIIKADSLEKVKIIAESDPFIADGFSTYELRTIELANEKNNYLLDN